MQRNRLKIACLFVIALIAVAMACTKENEQMSRTGVLPVRHIAFVDDSGSPMQPTDTGMLQQTDTGMLRMDDTGYRTPAQAGDSMLQPMDTGMLRGKNIAQLESDGSGMDGL